MSIFTPIHQYLLDISDREPLTNGRDDLLLRQLEQVKRGELPSEEGPRLAHQLIEGSVHLVIAIANRYYRAIQAACGGRSGLSLDDLVQVGNLALVECVQRCLITENTLPQDFSAYTGCFIKNALRDYRRSICPVTISWYDWSEAGKNGTLGKICSSVSLDAQPQGESDAYPSLSERIAAPVDVPVPLSIDERKRERVAQLLAMLTEQEQQIICLRYELDENDQRKHTYQEIADRLGCDPCTCSRVEQRILSALRDGTPLRSSSDYYSFTEAVETLGISPTALKQRVRKGVIHRYYPPNCDCIGVYRKAEIDDLALVYQHITSKYYLIEEAMDLLSLSYNEVRSLIRSGKLTRYHVPGRDNHGALFLKEDIHQMVREREEAARDYYSHEEASERLGISESSLWVWARKGVLTRSTHPGLSRVGYLKQDVDRLVAERETIARFLKKGPMPVTNITPLYEEVYAYAQ